MSDIIKFLTVPANFFSGFVSSYEASHFIVLGVPFDGTSSYKPGSRFGPSAIREASCNIETFSLRTLEDIEHVKICDIGDLWVTHGNLVETNKKVEQVTAEITKSHRFPIILGGEHSITYGEVKALGKDVAVIQFDAHMDLRDEYLGEKWSHATVMRRISEEVGVPNIIEVGTRAPSKEEYMFAKKSGLNFFTSGTVKKNPKETIEKIKNPNRQRASRSDRMAKVAKKIRITLHKETLETSTRRQGQRRARRHLHPLEEWPRHNISIPLLSPL